MVPALNPVIRPQDVERIHNCSLDLLERVGIEYKTPRALEVLERVGCPVDYTSNRARLPRELVEWALSQTPRVVRLEARDPEHAVVLNGRRSHYTTDSQGVEAIDLETGQRHDSGLEDLKRASLFADALDKIDIVNVSIAAGDVPAPIRTLRHFATVFTQTSKPVRSGVLRAEEVPFLVEMVKAVTGSETFKPIFSAIDCTISPFMHDGPMTEACIELAKLKVPIMVYPMPLAGGTSPVTPGGTIVLHNAEFLSGLVLYQAVNPGTPIIYGTGASQLDMKTGNYGGSADGNGLRLALRDIARFYHVPVNLWGLSTASKSLDGHYGYEATTHLLLAYLSGADEIYNAGLLGNAQIHSLEKMVFDNHITHHVEALIGPVLVDEEHLQIELIERVGIGGHYLGQPETRAFTKREYIPVWPPVGAEAYEVVRQEALAILHYHVAPPLPDGAADKLESIIAQATQVLTTKR